MITQIYSIQTTEEALACLEAGVDYIGLAAGNNAGLPAEISLSEARKIFGIIGNRAKKVALTVADEPGLIFDIVDYLKPDVIHICGNTFMAGREFCSRIKARCPGIAVEQAIGITGPEAAEKALYYGAFCDILILDSVDPAIPGIGAAGVVNDWDICAGIVQRAPCAVILAGGLGPHNVREAIEKVRPWGVDSLTKTNMLLPDGSFRKDPDKVREFVRIARETAASLGI
jgi:phosphoribosylanthranilate isomerase